MNKRFDLDDLLTDFMATARETLSLIDRTFGSKDLSHQFFGCDPSDLNNQGADSELVAQVRERVRKSSPWLTLRALYDYAVEGLEGNVCSTDIVLAAAEVIGLMKNEMHSLSGAWDTLLLFGNGRHALDEGMELEMEQVALLAGVDIRTVRNAASAGELVTFKTNAGEEYQKTYVDNLSCRRWLMKRRGFKPTVTNEVAVVNLGKISHSSELTALLKGRREELQLKLDDKEIRRQFADITAQALSELEVGVFSLPLNSVHSIADFYVLDRTDFLNCIMRVFFSSELTMLKDSLKPNERKIAR